MLCKKTMSSLWLFMFIVLFVCLYIPSIEATHWLSVAKLGSVATISTRSTCENLYGLSRRQVKICKRNLEVMDSVKYGAMTAIRECQWQFRYRRWNCSVVNATHIFGNVLKLGSREAAFVHAVSAAGVAHSVTRECSSGKLNKCGCDRSMKGSTKEGYHWYGCSENIAFGNAFSKSFVAAIERRDKSTKKKIPYSRVLMNQHNNEAGRMVLKNQMKIDCKCHGVSGSCEFKTCWKSLPSFRTVGSILKEKFDGATEVKQARKGHRRYLVPINKVYKPHTDMDLVYLQRSPSFCELDENAGSLGTHGRRCNQTSKAIDGCDLMCCNRGHTSTIIKVNERCHCKFHWCCYVTCRKCSRQVTIHNCK